jgi:hypothetical protein
MSLDILLPLALKLLITEEQLERDIEDNAKWRVIVLGRATISKIEEYSGFRMPTIWSTVTAQTMLRSEG